MALWSSSTTVGIIIGGMPPTVSLARQDEWVWMCRVRLFRVIKPGDVVVTQPNQTPARQTQCVRLENRPLPPTGRHTAPWEGRALKIPAVECKYAN